MAGEATNPGKAFVLCELADEFAECSDAVLYAAHDLLTVTRSDRAWAPLPAGCSK